MSVLQVYSSQEANFGQASVRMYWEQGFSGSGSTVPPGKTLEITTLTMNFYASGGGTVGRVEIWGRSGADIPMWGLQSVFVEPKKTVHLTFPAALRLEAGGYVDIGFTSEGPGIVTVQANGQLVGGFSGAVANGEAELPTRNSP